jgi:hypothetical protein
MLSTKQLLLVLAILPFVGGCGLHVPGLQGEFESKDYEKANENIIVNQIECELTHGIQETLNDPFFKTPGPLRGNSVDWLDTWAAQVTLDLTVEDKSTLSPGISLTEPYSAPSKSSRGIGIGVQGSADATHKESMSFAYSFADLYARKLPATHCANENGVLIHSDLQIADFIKNKAFVARVPGSLPASGYNGFSDELTFVVIYSANITPSWKFIRLSVNPTGTLFNGMRTRSQHVLITVGPAKSGTPATTPNQPAALAEQPQSLHEAGQIGHAVATAIQDINITP